MLIPQIHPDIKYIGVDDLDIDLFESQYDVPEGMAYNSYLILDEKIAVMDTADKRKGKEWMDNLAAALDGKQPDYLVVHHMEPDHSSMIAEFLSAYPTATVLASAKAIQMLGQFFPGYDFSGKTQAVKEGEEISLGKHSIKFFAAPMVHWPEVMVSYDPFAKVLFSADGFGKFGALVNETDDWACEARRYYFNICGKYGGPVQALLKKAATLDIATICPLHGPILTENLGYYIGLYDTWSKYEVETKGIFIAYASVYGGTEEAALKLAQMLREKGVPKVSTADICRDDLHEAVEDAFRMEKMVVAAPTYDGFLFPAMNTFIHELSLKTYQNRKVAIIENGSWAPAAGRIMTEMFSSMKNVEIVGPMVTIKSRLNDDSSKTLSELADALCD